MLNFNNKSVLFIAIFSLLSQTAMSQDCLTEEQYPNEWQNSRYSVHNDGTVTDTKTQLMWKVCTEGQTWNAGACDGNANEVSWQTALQTANDENFAGHSDWRLPNIKELQSLVAFNCTAPSINSIIFPNTAASGYWSSSPNANSSSVAWGVYFGIGNDGNNFRDSTNYVRVVRSGQ